MHGGYRKVALILVAVWAIGGAGWASDLPEDQYKEWTTEKEIFVPMRDGVRLSTDVTIPKGAPEKLPAILVRTPYDKDTIDSIKGYELYLRQGYALVVQNERGRFFSEGYFNNYLQGASTDGHDTVQWIIKQPWSSGKVSAIGASSPGETQWLMAVGNPPGLVAVIPQAAGTAVGEVGGNSTQGAFYRGGVPWMGVWAWWYHYLAASERLLLPVNSTQQERIRLRNTYSLATKFNAEGLFTSKIKLSEYLHLPSKDILRQFDAALTPFDQYIMWGPADPRWRQVERIGAEAKPRVPALHMVTWYDPAVGESTRFFKYLQDLDTPDQYLIIGAGPHGLFGGPALAKLKVGDLEVGDARYGGRDQGYEKLFLGWFGYWLRGEQNHVTDMPKVQLHVTGRGWISGDRWPLKETRFIPYYLQDDPTAPLRHEAGGLASRASARHEADRYVYDPGNPVPSYGGVGCCGLDSAAVDQRPVEARKDVLVYSTPPLDKPVTIAGPIEVVLYVSSSAKDTDFMVKLVDVYPNGKAINLSDDAFRVRYREGFDKKVLMRQSQVYKITLSNMVTAMQFAKGHKIRLDISSSNFPNYERNLNTGGNNYDETAWVVAENRVHHGGQYPSHIVLPVLPD